MILKQPERETAQYLIDKVGFNADYARAVIRNHKLHKVDEPNPSRSQPATYLKSDLDAIADFYLEGMKPIQDTQWDRKAIGKHFHISEPSVRRLVMDDDFPKPIRKFISMKGSRHTELWDAEIIKELKLESFNGYWANTRDEDEETAFLTLTQEGVQGDVLKFLIGALDSKSKKRRYEKRLNEIRNNPRKTQVVHVEGAL